MKRKEGEIEREEGGGEREGEKKEKGRKRGKDKREAGKVLGEGDKEGEQCLRERRMVHPDGHLACYSDVLRLTACNDGCMGGAAEGRAVLCRVCVCVLSSASPSLSLPFTILYVIASTRP